MDTMTVDGEVQEVPVSDAPADIYVGADDFSRGRPIGVESSAARDLAARVANPGQNLTPILFGGAGLAIGVNAGRTPAQRIGLGVMGALVGLLAYEMAAGAGWVA